MKSNKENVNLDLSRQDTDELKKHNISPGEVQRQVSLIKKGTNYVELLEPCTLNNGIKKIDNGNYNGLIKKHNEAAEDGRMKKFVPASGAASRMFKKLESVLNSEENINLRLLIDKREQKDEYRFTLNFITNITKFAFYDDLKKELGKNGYDLEALLKDGDVKTILKYLLTPEGMDYSNKSKGLIKFHKYDNENRTAFEEQIKEASEFLQDADKNIRLHFTIPPEQEDEYERLAGEMKEKYKSKGWNLLIEYSYQKKSTDTVALDKDGNLFRYDGKILFRPGGHGALIENLNDVKGDILFLKNIDNVQKERDLEVSVKNKKLLGGLLIGYRNRIFEILNQLENNQTDESDLENIVKFIKDDLDLLLPGNFESKPAEEKKSFLIKFLNRPVRVCGMMLNEGHPGGGPFWIKGKDGTPVKQIIEGSQVNKDDEKQSKIFNSSTHFNPVDIAVSVKNYKGESFDLKNYVDDSAVFVSSKSKNGRELKALELPGLWNGGMYDWITIFVEVPASTFTPVKEVNDLLNEEHS